MPYWTYPKLTWLITGASSGLGLSLTRFALSKNQHVIATSRNPSRTLELVTEVESSGGKWLQLDVTDPDGSSIISDLDRQGIQVDVLVNNAGHSILTGVELFEEKDLRDMMELHYFGPWRLIRAVLPAMRERRQGMVVNVGSGAGVFGREGMGAYGASKSAMDRLFHIMGEEISPFNVRSLNLILGAFDTPFVGNGKNGDAQLPKDYQGTNLDKNMNAGGSFVPPGSTDKASRIIYEMIMAEGIGEGKERERLMPLGSDMNKAWDIVIERYVHARQVFHEISESAKRDM